MFPSLKVINRVFLYSLKPGFHKIVKPSLGLNYDIETTNL